MQPQRTARHQHSAPAQPRMQPRPGPHQRLPSPFMALTISTRSRDYRRVCPSGSRVAAIFPDPALSLAHHRRHGLTCCLREGGLADGTQQRSQRRAPFDPILQGLLRRRLTRRLHRNAVQSASRRAQPLFPKALLCDRPSRADSLVALARRGSAQR